MQTVFDRPLYLQRLQKYRDSEFIKIITGVRLRHIVDWLLQAED